MKDLNSSTEAVAESTDLAPLTAYKGFNSDLTCRGFQYAEGGTYEHDGPVSLCSSGFHAVTSPLEVFGYYPPATSVYRVVELAEVSPERESDSKVTARRLTVGAKVNLAGLAQAHVEYVREHVDTSKEQTRIGDAASNTGARSAASNTGARSAASNTGYQSAASNTGYQSAASNTGARSAASNTGYQSAASNTGYQSAASNTGYQSAASNTGYQSAASNTGARSAASNTGYQSAASNTGYQSAASNTGYHSAASNTGDHSAASVSGEESVAIVTGPGSKAAGGKGCWIVLTERDENWHILDVKAIKVGTKPNGAKGLTVKPGVYYTLVGGKVVEAADQAVPS